MALIKGDTINVFSAFDGLNWTVISTTFDELNEILSAVSSNHSFPSTVYSVYSPTRSYGEMLYQYVTVDGFEYTFYWQDLWPFAYFTKQEIIPPTTTLTVSVLKTDETAPNEADGTATASASGGVPPYQYSLNNVDWLPSNEFTGLPFGNYTLYVKDSGTGIGSADFTIEPGEYPAPPPIIFPPKSRICISGGELETQGAFKRALVRTNFGTVPSTIFNGDFEEYDGQNWSQWVKYGGIKVSRGQRTVKNSSGVIIPIENYTLVFNEKANSGKFIENLNVNVKKGDTGKFSINIGTTLGTGIVNGSINAYNGLIIPARYRYTYEFKMRVKVGNFYLYNADGGNSFEWVTQLATVTTQVDNANGDVSSYIWSFNFPSVPVTGNMNIDLFGFAKIMEISTDEYKYNGVLPPLPATYQKQEIDEYYSIEIDDIKFEKSSQNKDNDVSGIIDISDNLNSYSKPLDEIEIPFGDYKQSLDSTGLNNTYAIYDQNDRYTTEWIDLGLTTTPYPIGLTLARSVMQAYQAPYYRFSGDLLKVKGADEFSFLDVNNFEVKGETSFNLKEFVILGCEIDLKHNIMSNITMREMFRRIPKTNDISVPASPTTPIPPIVNDTNNTDIKDIFTEEFTDIFK